MWRPIDNNNPEDRKIAVSALTELWRKTYYMKIEAACIKLYRHINLYFEMSKLVKSYDKNTKKTKEIQEVLEKIEKLEQKIAKKVPSINDCFSVFHVKTMNKLLVANGAEDQTLAVLKDRNNEYAEKIKCMKEQWQDKQWLHYLKKRVWAGFIKPLGIAIYSGTLMAPLADLAHFMGKPLITHLKVKKNRTKNTWAFKLKAIGAGCGFICTYFTESYFIVRMIIVGQILQKLGVNVNRNNYTKHSMFAFIINAGIISLESLYFGEFHLACTMNGMFGGMIFSNIACYFMPNLLPMPRMAVSDTQKTGINIVSISSHVLGSFLTKKGLEAGVIFPRLYARELAKAYLLAAEKYGLIKDLKFNMPTLWMDRALLFSDKNPLTFTALVNKNFVAANCQIAFDGLDCVPVPLLRGP